MKMRPSLMIAGALLMLVGCKSPPSEDIENVTNLASSDTVAEPQPDQKAVKINWLDTKSIISLAPQVSEGFVTTPLGDRLAVLGIETCRLIDGIDFSGEDSFSIRPNDVPEGLRNFAVIAGYGNNFIMFPDGSFLGEGPIISEGGDYIKGFPETMFFGDRRFNSLDFTQLPSFESNGFMKVNDWGIDQRKEDGVTYSEVGKHSLIIVKVGGQIDTYMPGTAPNIHAYLPDVRRPYFYDTKYVSADPDDVRFWIGLCTTTYDE